MSKQLFWAVQTPQGQIALKSIEYTRREALWAASAYAPSKVPLDRAWRYLRRRGWRIVRVRVQVGVEPRP